MSPFNPTSKSKISVDLGHYQQFDRQGKRMRMLVSTGCRSAPFSIVALVDAQLRFAVEEAANRPERRGKRRR